MIKAKVLVFAILVYPISLWSVCAGYWVCVAGYYGYKISRTCLGFAMRVFLFLYREFILLPTCKRRSFCEKLRADQVVVVRRY